MKTELIYAGTITGRRQARSRQAARDHLSIRGKLINTGGDFFASRAYGWTAGGAGRRCRTWPSGSYLLADVGLTQEEALREAAKPFWRA